MTDASIENPSATQPRKEKHARWLREGSTIGALLLVLLSARASLADHYHVPSGSMEPTVHIGDRIFVEKAAYGLRFPGSRWWLSSVGVPERGDVVVFRSPEDGTVLLKRVVAVPGDAVAVRAGVLWLNGRATSSPVGERRAVETLGREHRLRLAAGGGPELSRRVVPEGKLLVLGDNRGNSRDGRFFGWVDLSELLGRARGVYWRDGTPTWLRL